MLKRTPYWKRTNDVYGHRPKFDIDCKHCGTAMILRHSTVSRGSDDPEKRKDGEFELNYACYKCPICAWFIRFDVRDDVEYMKKVLDLRQGIDKLITLEDWDETEEIKRRLENLGYW